MLGASISRVSIPDMRDISENSKFFGYMNLYDNGTFRMNENSLNLYERITLVWPSLPFLTKLIVIMEI